MSRVFVMVVVVVVEVKAAAVVVVVGAVVVMAVVNPVTRLAVLPVSVLVWIISLITHVKQVHQGRQGGVLSLTFGCIWYL